MGELLKLAERCEKASGPDRDIDALIWSRVHPDGIAGVEKHGSAEKAVGIKYGCSGFNDPGREPIWSLRTYRGPAYTASLDAGMTLVPEEWRLGQLEENWRSRRWHCHLTERPSPALVKFFDEGKTIGYDSKEAEAATSALALCAAALRARAGQKP